MDRRVVVGLVGVALVGAAGIARGQTAPTRDPSSQPPVGMSPIRSIGDSINDTANYSTGVSPAAAGLPTSLVGPGQDAAFPKSPVSPTPVSMTPIEPIDRSINRGFGSGTFSSIFRRPADRPRAAILRTPPRVEPAPKYDPAAAPSIFSEPPKGGRPAPFAGRSPGAPRPQADAIGGALDGSRAGRAAPFTDDRQRSARPRSTAAPAPSFRPVASPVSSTPIAPERAVVAPTSLPELLPAPASPSPGPSPNPVQPEPTGPPPLPELLPAPASPSPSPSPGPIQPEPVAPTPVPDLVPAAASPSPVQPEPSPTPPIESGPLPAIVEAGPTPMGAAPEPLPALTPVPDEPPAVVEPPVIAPTPAPALPPMSSPVDSAVGRTSLDEVAVRTGPIKPRPLPYASIRAAAVGDEIITMNELSAALSDELRERGIMPGQLNNEQLGQAKQEIGPSVLNRMISQALIVQEAKKKLGKNPKAKEMFDEMIEKEWKAQELPPMLRNTASANVHELKIKLAAEGKSYESMKQQYRKHMMSQEFLRAEIHNKVTADLPEMKAYYNDHLDSFVEPARMTWREIEIKMAKYPTPAIARKKAEEALARLLHDEDFDAVARSISNGPTANKGGAYVDMSPGGYGIPVVNDELNRIPTGQVSSILEAPGSFYIIRVDSRREKGPLRFAEVQDKVRVKVINQNAQKAVEEYLAKLRSKTLIRTMFDNNPGDPQIARRTDPSVRRVDNR